MSSKATIAVLLLLAILTFIASTANSEQSHQKASFGSMLQQLKGSPKGHNTTGLHFLKHFLHKLGYLAGPGLDDHFDDALHSAIKSYQRNYRLDPTGSLDDATAEHMALPRCGHPDRESSHHRHHDYSPNQMSRWPPMKTALSYRFVTPVSPEVKAACAEAMRRWEQVTMFRFQEVGDGDASDVQIGMFRGEHGDTMAFDGPGGTLGHANLPPGGMMHLDSDEKWRAGAEPEQDEVDLESVALHELGHVLGLVHEFLIQEAVMFPTLQYGTMKRELHPNDIQKIRALYGLPPS